PRGHQRTLANTAPAYEKLNDGLRCVRGLRQVAQLCGYDGRVLACIAEHKTPDFVRSPLRQLPRLLGEHSWKLQSLALLVRVVLCLNARAVAAFVDAIRLRRTGEFYDSERLFCG